MPANEKAEDRNFPPAGSTLCKANTKSSLGLPSRSQKESHPCNDFPSGQHWNKQSTRSHGSTTVKQLLLGALATREEEKTKRFL